jgi:DNA invertase Pin-like site-specific DNA recombinase
MSAQRSTRRGSSELAPSSLGRRGLLLQRFKRTRQSFVSVTQQFNTTTSMGRLTLNVLLSFAQFEREVTGVQAALMTAQGQSRPFRPVLLAH